MPGDDTLELRVPVTVIADSTTVPSPSSSPAALVGAALRPAVQAASGQADRDAIQSTVLSHAFTYFEIRSRSGTPRGQQHAYYTARQMAAGAAHAANRCDQNEDIIGILIGYGFPSLIHGKEFISAVRLALGPRMAAALLQQHCKLRLVLPSAAGNHALPAAGWMARLHARAQQADAHMHVLCTVTHYQVQDPRYPQHGWNLGPLCSTTPLANSMSAFDTQYLAAYTATLRLVLVMKGRSCLPATSLHLELTGKQADGPANNPLDQVVINPGAALTGLTSLLPQLRKARIGLASSAPTTPRFLICHFLSALQQCPQLHVTPAHIRQAQGPP